MLNLFDLQPQGFGLNISDLSLKLARIKKQGSNFELSSWSKQYLKKGIVKEGEIIDQQALTDSIRTAIDQVQGQPLDTEYVVASLPEEKAFSQVIQMPKLESKELKQAVPFEAENYIPYSIDEVYLGSRIVEPVYDGLDHSDVLITAIPKRVLKPYLDCLKEADLKPQALEVESQSLARALIEDQVTEVPVLILDIGARVTRFVAYSGHSVRFSSSIPIASKQFTRALIDNLELSSEQAEQLKIKYGLLGPKTVEFKGKKENGFEKKIQREERFFEALVPVLTDFTEQIEKRIDYYRSHASHEHLPPDGSQIGRVLLCGGGANLKGLPKFLSGELETSVKLGNPWVNILPGEQEPPLALEDPSSFATALGLALRAVKK